MIAAEQTMVLALFAIAGALFVATGLSPLRYGRHRDPERGGLPVRLAWCVMALPGLALAPWAFIRHGGAGLVPTLMLTLWCLVYGWRALVYPWLLRGTANKRMPWSIVVFAIMLSSALGFINGLSLGGLHREYPLRWLWSIRFLYGLAMFTTGLVISRIADVKLTRLRAANEDGYVLPTRGFFRELTCPNYFGEVFMWAGWAILTWSRAGLACAAIAAALLIPRAVSNHLWCRRIFPNYPPSRFAIIPYLL